MITLTAYCLHTEQSYYVDDLFTYTLAVYISMMHVCEGGERAKLCLCTFTHYVFKEEHLFVLMHLFSPRSGLLSDKGHCA